jgi:pilus assembly protein CpaC
MLKLFFAPWRTPVAMSLAVAACLVGMTAHAQTQTQPVTFNVSSNTQKLEMTVNTSRILTLEHSVPRMLVNNTDVIRATPLSPNKVQLSAVKTGATQVNFWDEKERVYTVDIVVLADVGDLQRVLEAEFPEASLQLRPTNTSVIISGYVPQPEMVGAIVRIAEDYYPRVINRLTVGGVQQIMLKVKVMEVSRTKLRRLGVNWTATNGSNFLSQTVGGVIAASSPTEGSTVTLGLVNNSNSFEAYINALQKHDLIKLLAEPTLVTTSGRPASFNSGGQFPILVPQSLGTVTVQFREFGTRVDFVPLVLGNGAVRLEVRPAISELDQSRGVIANGTAIPAIRERWLDTAVEMRAGQTMALGGLIYQRTEAAKQGIPYLGDLPWVGAGFRTVKEEFNELELLVLVTPEFVDAMDPEEVPACGPGQATESPCDKDLYWKGLIEVPKGYGQSCEGNNCRHGRCGHNGRCANGQCQNGQGENGSAQGHVYGPQEGSTVITPYTESIGPGVEQPQVAPPQTRTTPSQHRPATTTGERRTNSHLVQNQSSRRNPRPQVSNSQSQEPQLIGPVGYDVLK